MDHTLVLGESVMTKQCSGSRKLVESALNDVNLTRTISSVNRVAGKENGGSDRKSAICGFIKWCLEVCCVHNILR